MLVYDMSEFDSCIKLYVSSTVYQAVALKRIQAHYTQPLSAIVKSLPYTIFPRCASCVFFRLQICTPYSLHLLLNSLTCGMSQPPDN